MYFYVIFAFFSFLSLYFPFFSSASVHRDNYIISRKIVPRQAKCRSLRHPSSPTFQAVRLYENSPKGTHNSPVRRRRGSRLALLKSTLELKARRAARKYVNIFRALVSWIDSRARIREKFKASHECAYSRNLITRLRLASEMRDVCV